MVTLCCSIASPPELFCSEIWRFIPLFPIYVIFWEVDRKAQLPVVSILFSSMMEGVQESLTRRATLSHPLDQPEAAMNGALLM